MLRLALSQLRRRVFRYVALFITIFAAAGLTTVAATVTASLQSSIHDRFAKDYRGASAVAQVDTRDAQAVQRLRSLVPGGAADSLFEQRTFVAMQLDSAASVPGQPSHPVQPSHPGQVFRSVAVQSIADSPLQWRELYDGHLPGAPVGDPLAADAAHPVEVLSTDRAVPLGSTMRIRLSSSSLPDATLPARVVGHAQSGTLYELAGTDVLLAHPDTVAAWAGQRVRGELRARASDPQAAAALVGALRHDPAVISAASQQAHVAELADGFLGKRSQYLLLLTAFLLVTAVVAALVIFSGYSVLASQRVREFALLRAVGATRAQLLGSVSAESFVLAAVAAPLGAVAGVGVADWAVAHAQWWGISAQLQLHRPAAALLVAVVGAAVVVTWASAVPAAALVTRRPVTSGLRAAQSAPLRPRVVVAVLLLAVLWAAAGWYALRWVLRRMPGAGAATASGSARTTLYSIAGAGGVIVAMLLVLAVLWPLVLRWGAGALRRWPMAQLGVAFTGRQQLRAAALVGIIMAGCAFTGAVLQGRASVEDALLQRAGDRGSIDVSVSALDGDLGSKAEDLVRRWQADPFVAAAVAPVGARVTAGGAAGGAGTAQGAGGDPSGATGDADGGAAEDVLALTPAEAAQISRTPSPLGAGVLVLGVGSPLRQVLGEGVVGRVGVGGESKQVRVRYHNEAFSLIDANLLPHPPAGAPAWPRPAVLARAAAPATVAQDDARVAALRRSAGELGEPVRMDEAFAARGKAVETAGRLLTLSLLLAVVAMVTAAVGVVNTIVMSVRERRGDLALLRSVGMTAAERVRALLVEVVALAVPAAVVGAVSGAGAGVFIAAVATGSPVGGVAGSGVGAGGGSTSAGVGAGAGGGAAVPTSYVEVLRGVLSGLDATLIGGICAVAVAGVVAAMLLSRPWRRDSLP